MNEELVLRAPRETDLEALVEFEMNPEARWMAAFGAKDPVDRGTTLEHWRKILQDESSVVRTIVLDGRVAGYVLRAELLGKPCVAYWVGNEYWGKGVATRALREFLRHVDSRPIYARVAKDNIASRRVLEKCGFTVYGEEHSYANARKTEIDELLLILPPS
ncbi:MAG: GNAT family N-acetyltransferase [Thermoplasmata archaeon]